MRPDAGSDFSFKALLRSREERLSQLLTEANALVGSSEEVGALRAQVEVRRGEVETLKAKLDKTQHLHRQTAEIAEQRGQELARARKKSRALEQLAEERADAVARLQTELDVRQLELKQTKEACEALGAQVDDLTDERESLKQELAQRRGELDRVRNREAELRRRLFELDGELIRRRVREGLPVETIAAFLAESCEEDSYRRFRTLLEQALPDAKI